jgi:sugar lactone lactonase YvrE
MSRSATALRESPIVPDTEALIREARRRQRRRWTAVGAALIALPVGAVVAFGHHGRTDTPRARRPATTRHAPVAPNSPTPAIEPKQPGPLAIGPDGTLYIADDTRDQILALKNGRFRVAVGNGKAGFRGDDGLATKAEINFPAGMTFHDGTLYFADTMNGRIRAVSPFGIITTIAGNGGTARRGWVTDGTPVLDASLNPSAVAFGPNGAMYVASDPMVLRLDAHGRFTRVLGNYDYDGLYGVGGPAVDGSADGPNGLVFDAQGNLYVAGSSTKRLLMVDTHGTLRSIAILYPRGNGGLLSGPDGTAMAMGEFGVERLTPTGVESVFSTFGRPFHGVSGFSPNGIAIAPDGTTFLDTYWGNGYANKSAIAVIRPNGTSSLLWMQEPPPGA